MKIKKRTIKIAFLLFIIILAAFLTYRFFTKNHYQFKVDTFHYSKYRKTPEYSMSLKESNSSFDVYTINYISKNFLSYETKIYGLLFMPKLQAKVPGIVLLPGGGVKKEDKSKLASKLADWGYAVLTIDQRGIGETGGYYLNFEQDYEIFSKGDEPIQHLSVYDALAAFDVLRQIKGVDNDNIAIAGESMGGRYALITAALDKRLKGVIGISTSGFHYKKTNAQYDNYMVSIDPDHYVSAISQNWLLMIHGTKDKTISLNDAKATFDAANEPKKFFIVEGCGHGYCDKMDGSLKESLGYLFNS